MEVVLFLTAPSPPSADPYQSTCTQLRKTSALPWPLPPLRCPHSVHLWDKIACRPYRKICGRPKCSWECRERWASKTARCLIRSFEELPPTHMIRLTSFAMLTD